MRIYENTIYLYLYRNRFDKNYYKVRQYNVICTTLLILNTYFPFIKLLSSIPINHFFNLHTNRKCLILYIILYLFYITKHTYIYIYYYIFYIFIY